MKAKTKSSSQLSSLEHQVRAQLRALGQALEETARQYVLRLHREIAGVSDLMPPTRGRKSSASRDKKKLQQMARILGSLQVKSAKGRRKDLKRIDELIGEIENLLH